jgi:hypothetical protein
MSIHITKHNKKFEMEISTEKSEEAAFLGQDPVRM